MPDLEYLIIHLTNVHQGPEDRGEQTQTRALFVWSLQSGGKRANDKWTNKKYFGHW